MNTDITLATELELSDVELETVVGGHSALISITNSFNGGPSNNDNGNNFNNSSGSLDGNQSGAFSGTGNGNLSNNFSGNGTANGIGNTIIRKWSF